MRAQVGDRVHIHGRSVGRPEETAVVVEVRGEDGAPPYLVRHEARARGARLPRTGLFGRARRVDGREPSEASRVSRVVARVHGDVQGVGFRWFTRQALGDLGLDGSARNLADGTVEVVASGDRQALERLVAELEGPSAPGSVARVDVDWEAAAG